MYAAQLPFVTFSTPLPGKFEKKKKLLILKDIKEWDTFELSEEDEYAFKKSQKQLKVTHYCKYYKNQLILITHSFPEIGMSWQV